MKIRIVSFLLLISFTLCLTSCGEAKRPIDYPDTTWTCDVANITFSVSDDSDVTNATMIDKNGETITISLVFTDMEEGKVSITNADETEVYLTGTCTYDNDMFSIFVTDIFNPDLNITSTRLTFNRS